MSSASPVWSRQVGSSSRTLIRGLAMPSGPGHLFILNHVHLLCFQVKTQGLSVNFLNFWLYYEIVATRKFGGCLGHSGVLRAETSPLRPVGARGGLPRTLPPCRSIQHIPSCLSGVNQEAPIWNSRFLFRSGAGGRHPFATGQEGQSLWTAAG